MTVDKIVDYSKNRRDAFWFATDDSVRTVAVVTDTKTGRRATIKAVGDVQVRFEETDKFYHGEDAVREALRRGMTDKELNETADSITGMNNWFEIEVSGQIDFDKEIDYTLYDIDEAIHTAKKLLKEVVK